MNDAFGRQLPGSFNRLPLGRFYSTHPFGMRQFGNFTAQPSLWGSTKYSLCFAIEGTFSRALEALMASFTPSPHKGENAVIFQG
jgi:hypothetical protein